MRSPFFIVGPTAVGKSEIAAAVAERCGGEIINADAFQLYAGLELLTAKPTPEQRARAPHHLIGTVPLSTSYSVAQYREDAQRCFVDVAERRGLAIVVGGSGMYVKALTHGLSPLPPALPAMRAELEELDLETLLRRLRVLDPFSADAIDTRNKRRLVRALEVCVATGRRFSEFRDLWYSPTATVRVRGVFLVRDRDELTARINHRVASMFTHGVLEEVRAIPPGTISETASRMIGWREIQAYFDDRIDLRSCMGQVEKATRRYAKRQMTWFRGETVFEERTISDGDDSEHVVDFICEQIKRLLSQ